MLKCLVFICDIRHKHLLRGDSGCLVQSLSNWNASFWGLAGWKNSINQATTLEPNSLWVESNLCGYGVPWTEYSATLDIFLFYTVQSSSVTDTSTILMLSDSNTRKVSACQEPESHCCHYDFTRKKEQLFNNKWLHPNTDQSEKSLCYCIGAIEKMMNAVIC